MQPASEDALKAIDNCWVYLHGHRHRTHYGKLRRGGYAIGSGESNHRTSLSVMCGSSGQGRGGMRPTAMRCWCFAVPSITAPSIECSSSMGSAYEKRNNDRMLLMVLAIPLGMT